MANFTVPGLKILRLWILGEELENLENCTYVHLVSTDFRKLENLSSDPSCRKNISTNLPPTAL